MNDILIKIEQAFFISSLGPTRKYEKEVSMSASPQWEYLTVLVSPEFLDYEEIHPKSVNGHELKDGKKIDMNSFLSQLGMDSWEMAGTISIAVGEARTGANYLFFKRIKS